MSLAGRPKDVAARMSKIPWYRYPESTAQLLLEQLTRFGNNLVDNGVHGCPPHVTAWTSASCAHVCTICAKDTSVSWATLVRLWVSWHDIYG